MKSPTFDTLDRAPAYLKVSHAIEEKIRTGALSDGTLLPTEADLCSQFGVTRSTVREGIRLLQQSGLVARGPKKRLIVTRPNAGDVAAATSKSLSLSGATFHEVWESLKTLYPEAARIAAHRISGDTLNRLTASADKLNDASLKAPEIVALAVNFFDDLAAGIDNRVLAAMLQSLNLMIGASLTQVIKKTPNARKRIATAQHNMIDAFRAKDADAAAQWMAKHIDDLKRGYRVAKVRLDRNVI